MVSRVWAASRCHQAVCRSIRRRVNGYYYKFSSRSCSRSSTASLWRPNPHELVAGRCYWWCTTSHQWRCTGGSGCGWWCRQDDVLLRCARSHRSRHCSTLLRLERHRLHLLTYTQMWPSTHPYRAIFQLKLALSTIGSSYKQHFCRLFQHSSKLKITGVARAHPTSARVGREIYYIIKINGLLFCLRWKRFTPKQL